ncbi:MULTISPECIES: hypothetical protein [unclassified Nocardia]|uniref:hypothetical protein n=1 Tax=unclassified Nocardia TaxID=2637762 RepID=UPI00278BC4C2|nr:MULTISPECIES: hypothetical protein [unclassified Nocardia]
MATNRVRLHTANLGKLLKTEFGPMVNDAARKVAAAAGDDAFVEEYTTDRQAAAVMVPAEQQAIDGKLTRAAAAVGLEVRAKP